MNGNDHGHTPRAGQSWYASNDGNTHLWAEDPSPDGYRRVLRLSLYTGMAEDDPAPLPAALIEIDRTDTPIADLMASPARPDSDPWPASALLIGPILGYLATVLTETTGRQ